MRRAEREATRAGHEPPVNTDQDRYPDVVTGLRRIIAQAELPEGPVEWLEVNFAANGEGTCRWRHPRSDEIDGVLLRDENEV